MFRPVVPGRITSTFSSRRLMLPSSVFTSPRPVVPGRTTTDLFRARPFLPRRIINITTSRPLVPWRWSSSFIYMEPLCLGCVSCSVPDSMPWRVTKLFCLRFFLPGVPSSLFHFQDPSYLVSSFHEVLTSGSLLGFLHASTSAWGLISGESCPSRTTGKFWVCYRTSRVICPTYTSSLSLVLRLPLWVSPHGDGK